MNEIIYLEPDSEITAVIDRIKKTDSSSVALVIPRGATLAQSIVNLKLLKKSAESIDKEITLVSNDRISRNLASQIGLTVFSKVAEAQRADFGKKRESVKASDSKMGKDDGFQVNNYYRDKEEEEKVEEETDEEIEEETEEEDENEEEIENTDQDENEESEEIKPEEKVVKEKEKEEKKEEPRIKENMEKKKPPVEDLRKSKFKLSRKPILIIVSVCVALLLLVSFIFVPYSTVSIGLKTEDTETETSILADKSVEKNDLAKLTIPATLLDLEKESSKDFNSTGTKDLGEKATGTATFYNAYNTQSYTIPAGTKVTSADNKVFITLSAITVPGGSVDISSCKPGANDLLVCNVNPHPVDGQLIAQNNGSDYNIPASKFSITGYSSKIYAESKSAFTGGVTKTVKVVTESNLTDASVSLKDELSKSSKAELIEKAKTDKLIISEPDIKSEVISESTSKKVDEESDTFTYSVKMKFYVLGFLDENLKNISRDSVIEKIGSEKMLVNSDQSDISYKIIESNVDSGIIKITSLLKGKIGPKIDQNKVISEVKNKSVAGAKSKLLSDSNISEVKISVWPTFYKRLPLIKNRIKIKFEYAQ